MNAYLQHGWAPEPCRTETVEARETDLPRARRSRDGYGPRIATELQVHYNGRWRRVYVANYGNSGTAYIGASLASGIRVTRC